MKYVQSDAGIQKDSNKKLHFSFIKPSFKAMGGIIFFGKLTLFCRSVTKLPVVFYNFKTIQSRFRDIRGQSQTVQQGPYRRRKLKTRK